MDESRPRGPEERGMVPQGPEDAAEDGDRSEQRRQMNNSTCSERGIGIYIGGMDLYCALW